MNIHLHGNQTDTQGQAIAAPVVKDPVCGMTVRPETAAGNSEFGGKTWHFCSPSCKKKFDASPETFAKSATQAPSPNHMEKPSLAGMQSSNAHSPSMAKPDSRIYTCPMHPEVRQNGPGSCPKCGMALEPLTADLQAAEENPELKDMLRRFWVSLGLSLPLVAIAMGHLIAGTSLRNPSNGRPALD